MRNKTHVGLIGLGSVVLALGATSLTASPALAAYNSKTCTVTNTTTGSCTTDAIPAHSSQHWIRYWVSTGYTFAIRDVNRKDKRIVAQGYGNSQWHTVHGLYSSYNLTVGGVGGSGTISNYT